jgi:predicted GH43/DUF377 family glycosyl hydrolase
MIKNTKSKKSAGFPLLGLIVFCFLVNGCVEVVQDIIKKIELESKATKPSSETPSSDTTASSSADSYYQWDSAPAKLLIRYGQTIPDMIWNDPSVMKDGPGYKMWLSGGKLSDRSKNVNVYLATSEDGITWEIGAQPVLSPGDHDDFDGKGIETPSVIKVDDTYHMYYSGANFKDSHTGRFSIGHATSPDGIHWTKDPNNPVIPRTFNGLGPGEGKPNAWGWLSVAEPGAVYHEGQKKIYVYYVGTKLRKDDYTGDEPKTQMGIMLATSTDGSHFTFHPEAVLVQTESYPHREGYYGYSTPSAYIDKEGRFHLFYDAAKRMNAHDQFRQVSLAHAISDDGLHFTEKDIHIVRNNRGGWMNVEVRAPFAIEENDTVMLYFAGGWKEGGIGCIRGTPKNKK